MADDVSTILHRKDERGVIVESRVFGPDDEVPEEFGPAEYQPVYAPREDDQAPVAESVLTPWGSPIAKGTWIEQDNETVEEAAEEFEPDEDPDDDEDELDEGSVLQARQQAGEELTEAEQEALAAFEQAESEKGEGDQPPPKGGAGSGADAWAAYAASKGVEVEDGASRDEIIAACEAAGVPVD